MHLEFTKNASDYLNTCDIKLIKPYIPKKTSLKEIRQRGFQRKKDIKIGVRTDQDITFNDIVGELSGKIYYNNETIEGDTLFTYFLDDYNIFIASPAKSFRKSCRPNCVVKLRKCDDKYCLLVFAIRNITLNEELLVGFDYRNSVEEFKCVCNDTDFCLLKTINK